MDWAQVLVIILSIFLTLFLLAGITLVVMLIRVTHQIKQVTTAAQHTVDMIGRNAGRVQGARVSAFIAGRISRLLKNSKKK